jgi:hypothetical protein
VALVASTRPKGVTRKTGINVLPIVIYIVVALVVTAGMFAWDVRYRRAEDDRRKPPAPEMVARNLVENAIGANTVRDVKVDREKKSIAVTFESTQFNPGKPKAVLRELLEAEAVIATKQILLPPSPLREFDKVTATLVKDGKTLAVAEASRGADRVTMTYVDERLKD